MLHFSGYRTPTREYVNGFLTVDGAKVSLTRDAGACGGN